MFDPTPATLLLVDDNPSMLQILCRWLERDGYNLVTAANGHEALAAFAERPPDLVLLDVMMPGPNGIEVCQRLRQMQGGAQTPVLMVTALEDADTVDRAFAAGATDYITKPVNPFVLSQRIRTLLRVQRADAARQASEQRYRAMVDTQTEMVCRWRPDGVFTFANAAAVRALNRPLEQVLGQTLVSLMPASVQSLVRQRIETVVRQLTPAEPRVGPIEQLEWGGDRPAHWLRWTHHGLFDEAGHLVEVQSVGVDITDRKRAEDALRASEERYRAVVDSQTEMICRWRPDGTLSFVNEAYARQFDRPAVELLGQQFADLLPEPDQPPVRARLADLVSRLTPAAPLAGPYEHRATLPGGALAWQRWSDCAFFDENGVLVEIQSVGRDVTARKLAEDKLRLQSAALNAAANAIVITNPQGVIEWVNPAFTALTGYTADEVIGQTPRALRSGQHSAEFYASLWQTIASGQVWQGEIVNRRKDGSLYTETMTITPVRDDSGALTHYVAIKQDVTEQRHLQQQMLAAQKLADIGTLAAGVAHEINSPLQVITGLSQSSLVRLDSGEPLDLGRLRRNLDNIQRNGWRCAEIVRSLRTYAHVGGGNFELNDLNAVVRDALLLIEHQLSRWANITLTTHYQAGLPAFCCDRNQITQVIINLLTNARDAMPSGGSIDLRTGYEAESEQLILRLADNGQGIPEAVQAKIFDPFFTTKPLGKGTGLGLSIVSGIVRAHGGQIAVESAPRQGTTFTLHFPLSASETKAQLPAVWGRFDDALGSWPGIPANAAHSLEESQHA
jgi:PAS domain S-box-containing protein